MDIKRQKFLVMGLSKSGEAAATFLLSQGARVGIYDDLDSERISLMKSRLTEAGADDISRDSLNETVGKYDALVLSPGIPIDHPLAVAFKRAGKAVLGETELAARYFKGLSVGITGTNGKTTTVSMVEKILKESGLAAKACGNIGAPMLEVVPEPNDTVAIAEISSFQLETLNSFCPHIAVVLNITEDHLNRHYNMENYIFLKRKILKNLTETEYAVLNYDDPIVRAFAEGLKAKTVWFSLRERVNGAYFSEGELYYGEEKILSAEELFVSGLHNVQNALAAIACAKILGVETEQIVSSLKEFRGVKHRIERVGEVDGVAYVDDSKGTNVDATIKAVANMKTETVLLLGGKDKGYDYGALFSAIKGGKAVAAVLYGENRYALLAAARKSGFAGVYLCPAFAEGVALARMVAKSGQTVLLSPASASFDEFSGYEERGEKFCAIVREFANEAQSRETVCEATAFTETE
ncbi:MAG: UDP-N-acetylmuramoyl-L-alanine--D-glutamate ligase [Clostridia bacterium]|nr:UDP-N-acetylmuramoyl-L-alanine--D-glutamate ligase [Clostridia bacterium]